MFADEFFRAKITLHVLAVTSSRGKKEVVPHFKMEMRSVTAICVVDLTDLFSFSLFSYQMILPILFLPASESLHPEFRNISSLGSGSICRPLFPGLLSF